MYWIFFSVFSVIALATYFLVELYLFLREKKAAEAAKNELELTFTRLDVQKYVWSVANIVVASMAKHQDPQAEILAGRLESWRLAIEEIDLALAKIGPDGKTMRQLHSLTASAYLEQSRFHDLQRSMLLRRKATRERMPSIVEYVTDPFMKMDDSGTVSRRPIQPQNSGVSYGDPLTVAVA